MSTSSNTERLKKLMSDHRLKAPDVAKLIGRSAHTVRVWRCVNDNVIPDAMLEFLELKIAQTRELA